MGPLKGQALIIFTTRQKGRALITHTITIFFALSIHVGTKLLIGCVYCFYIAQCLVLIFWFGALVWFGSSFVAQWLVLIFWFGSLVWFGSSFRYYSLMPA